MTRKSFSIKEAWETWKSVDSLLKPHRYLKLFFWSGPFILSFSFLMFITIVFAALFDRLFYWNIPALDEIYKGRWQWLDMISLNHEPSLIPVGIILTLVVIGFLYLFTRYTDTINHDKLHKEITEVSKIIIPLIFIFGGFLLAPSGSIYLQFGTILALVIAGVGLIESMILSNRIQKIFGFHSYIKIGADVYRSSKEWTCSIVSNWEISKQIQFALEKLDNRKKANGSPIHVSFCGPINSNNFLGILWRIGVWQNMTNKPRMFFHIPRDRNTPRFAINEQEVLLASSPTDEKRDLYGFLKRDSDLATVYKRIYSQLISRNNIMKDIGNLLQGDTPFGLGTAYIDFYMECYVEKIALPVYLDQLKKDGLEHRIENNKDLDDVLKKIRKGLDYILLKLESEAKVQLLRVNEIPCRISKVIEWNL